MKYKIKNFDGSVLLLALFIAVSVYMYINAQEFGSSAQMFPRFAAVGVVVGSLLIFFRDISTEYTRLSIFDGDKKEEEWEESEIRDNEETDKNTFNVVILVSMTILYILAGHLVGLFWVTPIFAAAYTIWAQLSWHLIIGITFLSVLVSYAFLAVFQLPIASGILT